MGGSEETCTVCHVGTIWVGGDDYADNCCKTCTQIVKTEMLEKIKMGITVVEEYEDRFYNYWTLSDKSVYRYSSKNDWRKISYDELVHIIKEDMLEEEKAAEEDRE